MMTGCGVIDHDTMCLCDVVIPHPTGWVDDAIQDMWMGQEIAKIMDYKMPWEDCDILDYLNDLVVAKDNWPKSFGMSVADITQMDADIRTLLRQKLGAGESIESVMAELGLTMVDMRRILFADRRDWSLEKLLEFEKVATSGVHSSVGALGKQFGLPHKSAVKLVSYWGIKFEENLNPSVTLVIDEVLEQLPELSNNEVMAVVNERLQGMGIMITVKRARIKDRRFFLNNRKGRDWK